MNILAFTGTRNGMTLPQKEVFRRLLLTEGMKVFLNGCAIGADREAMASISLYPKVEIECYPGDASQSVWAWKWVKDYNRSIYLIYPIMPYLHRNKVMAERCDHLISTPGEDHEVRRSGTWMTIRAARRAGKMVTVIYPDGSIEYSP